MDAFDLNMSIAEFCKFITDPDPKQRPLFSRVRNAVYRFSFQKNGPKTLGELIGAFQDLKYEKNFGPVCAETLLGLLHRYGLVETKDLAPIRVYPLAEHRAMKQRLLELGEIIDDDNILGDQRPIRWKTSGERIDGRKDDVMPPWSNGMIPPS